MSIGSVNRGRTGWAMVLAGLLLTSFLAFLTGFPGKAEATGGGDINPRTGGSDYCVSENGEDGNSTPNACIDGIGLGIGVSALEVSPDGKRLFIAGFDSFGGSDGDSITTYDRGALGGLLSLDPRAAACRSATSAPGCSPADPQAALLTAPTGVAVSPDSNQVYVTARRSHSVTTFDYLAFPGAGDPSGTLGPLARKPDPNGCMVEGSPVSCSGARGLLRTYDLALAPDGETLYTAGNHTGNGGIAVFGRALDGVLTQKSGMAGCVNDTGADGCADGNSLEPTRLAISADGENLYAVSVGTDPSRNTLAVFDINPDGTIVQQAGVAGCFSESGSSGACTAVPGLLEPQDVSVTPDGESVFVSSINGSDGGAIRLFDRNAATGALTPRSDPGTCFNFDGSGGCTDATGLYRPFTLLATDEAVYIGSNGDGMSVPGALVVLQRNETTGALNQKSPTGCWARGILPGCVNLATIGNVRALAISPDGDNLYVGSDILTIFDRDDGEEPETTINSGPSGQVATTELTTDVTFTFSTDKAGTGFECNLNGASQACTSPQTYSDLPLGAYNFKVVAVDMFDRRDFTAAERNFTLADLTSPETTIDSGPPASSTLTSADFSFSATEPGSTFQCSLDGAAFSTCSSPHHVAGLAVGAHDLRVRAIDPWGNLDPTPASHPFTVLSTGPGPDESVIATVTAARVQKIKGRKVAIDVTVEAGESLTVMASGSVKKGKVKVALKSISRNLASGQISTFRLRPARQQAASRLAAALKGGKRTVPALVVTMTDAAMNRQVKRPKVKLLGPPRRR